MNRQDIQDSMKDVTAEEVSKLTRAMKDKQFQSHMDEYSREISDPAHRKEYLQYLDQLEAKGEMPDGQCLLRAEPGCCVKTTIRFKNGQDQKCFINIVYSDQLEDMSELPDESGANKGKRVHMPYSLGPPRPERDNKDEMCMTVDFAVGTWTFGQAIQRPQILKMLVDTASEGLTGNFLKGHEEVKKDFKVMRRVKCRGPGHRPLPMSVKAELLKDKGKSKRPAYSPVAEQSAVTPSELKEMRKEAKEKMLKPPAPIPDDEEEEVPKKPQDAPETTAGRIRVPKHKLVHSGYYDFTDFMEASNRPTMLAQPVPRLLKLVVELPTVKKVSDITLEVTTDNVCIEVPDKYYLDLPLSFEIDEDKGDAKFDKAKQTLTLELPVKPKPPDPNLLANRAGFPTEAEGEDESEGALSDGGGDTEDLPPLEDPLVDSEPPPPTPASPSTSPKASKESQPTSSVPDAQAQQEAPPKPDDLVPEEELASFIPSDSFTGARLGYVFKLDEEGLGYYRDLRQRRPMREASKTETQSWQKLPVDDGAPIIEEVDSGEFRPSDFVSAKAMHRTPQERPALPEKAQHYMDVSTLLTTRIAATDIEEISAHSEPSVECHQTRQNLVLLVGTQAGHDVADVQLLVQGRRLIVAFCTRSAGGQKWRRHHVRRTLLRQVDSRQWHAEIPKLTAEGAAASLVIVLRKAEQERWPEIFDESAAAAAVAEREPILLSSNDVSTPGDNASSQASTDHTAAADTAAGTDVDVVVEDSAELDIAAPTGVPVALGPTELISAKEATQPSGPSAPLNAAAANAAAQSASVMGQAVLLRTRLMYQLF